MDVRRNGRRIAGPRDDIGRLLPELAATIGPDVDFPDSADGPRPQHFERRPKAIEGRALGAHLRTDAIFLGRLAQGPCFMHAERERFLRIDVLTQPDRHHRRRGMRVIGRADGHGVDLAFHIFKQPAEVIELARLGKLLCLGGQMVVVDIADRDHVAVIPRMVGVARSFAPHTDAGYVELLIGRPRGGQHICPDNPSPRSDRGGGFEKLTTIVADRHMPISC